MRAIDVTTPSRSYDVIVGRDLLAGAGQTIMDACGGTAACVVTDDNVSALYADTVAGSLAEAGYEIAGIEIAAGEESKNARVWSGLVEGMASAGMTRDDVVVALGGGVVGDLAGFAAATYMRGCQVAQVPTSLLAMVDSSVGGKTAIDLAHGKNLAGAFLQPSVVIADVDCLGSLSHDLLTDSCGEVIKHGVIADRALFDDISSSPINAGELDLDRLERVVARNVEIKRDVVSEDERERGIRQTLNFGHTMGHAIEAAEDFRLGHGTSVAIGMCCMARACAKRAICSRETADAIIDAVASYGLPTTTDIDPQRIYEIALSDKKRHGATLNVVVVLDIGHVEVRGIGLEDFHELVNLGCAEA